MTLSITPKMITNGIEHGLMGTLVNQVPKAKRFQKVSAEKKAELERKMKADGELEKVRYINFRNQDTGQLYKDYSVGAGEPIYLFNFLHDQVYTIPRGLIDQVNDTTRLPPKREGSLDPNGQPLTKDGGKKRIHQFIREL
jgi:hypothetical protein